MKTTLNNAIKLAQQISSKYNELDGDSPIFDLYHDDLSIQSDCAWQEVDEIEEYLKNKKKVYGINNEYTGLNLAEISMQNLTNTLIYVSFIIDIQNQLNKCPKSIYG